MRRILFALLGPPLLLLSPAPFGPAASRTADAREQFDPGVMAAAPAAQPRPQVEHVPTGTAIGWVTAVDGKSITIRLAEPIARDRPPVQYTAHPILVAGGIVAQYAVYPPYPLADVRVGDLVMAEHGTYNRVLYEVSILRRPGGRLGPPSVAPVGVKIRYLVGYDRQTRIPYHEAVNALQDFEARVIPLPPGIVPGRPEGEYLRPDGTPTTWSIPPLPLWRAGDPPPARPGPPRAKRTDPIPPPREVPAKR